MAEYMEEKSSKRDELHFRDLVISDNNFKSKYDELTASLQTKTQYNDNYTLSVALGADIEQIENEVGEDPDEILERLLEPPTTTRLHRHYQLNRVCAITAYLPIGDCNSTAIKQSIRCELKDDVHWNYLEGVQYQSRQLKPFGSRPLLCFGFIQAVLESRPYPGGTVQQPCSHVCIIRRLEQTPAEQGNIRIVEEYGYTRFQYMMGTMDVNLDVVPLENIMRKVLILPDIYWLSSYYDSIEVIYAREYEDQRFRKEAKFFLMKNFRESWIGECKL